MSPMASSALVPSLASIEATAEPLMSSPPPIVISPMLPTWILAEAPANNTASPVTSNDVVAPVTKIPILLAKSASPSTL